MNHTVKYGFLSFLYNCDIKAATPDGVSVRSSLKTIWEYHATNDAMKTYLGTSITEQVLEVLGIDKNQKRDNKPAVAKGKAQTKAAVSVSAPPAKAKASGAPATKRARRR